MSIFSKNLKREREDQGITQAALARKSSVSQQAISAIEAGVRSPTEETMQMLSDALGCTLSYMLSSSSDVSAMQSAEDLTMQEIKLVIALRQNPQLKTAVMAVLAAAGVDLGNTEASA